MQTSASWSNWVWALTFLGSLALLGSAQPVAAQGRPANPLRVNQMSPATPTQGDRNASVSRDRSAIAASYDTLAAPRTVGFVPRHERIRPRGFRPAQYSQPIPPDSRMGSPTPATPIPADSVRVEAIRVEPMRIAPGEILVKDPAWDGDVFGDGEPGMPMREMAMLPTIGPGIHSGGPSYGDASCCDSGCCDGGGCDQCSVPCPLLPWENLELLSGVQGFTGPANRGETGSFGFHAGFNWGTPLPIGSLGGQIGVEWVSSNYSGAEFSGSQRNQVFLTAGLFRRVDVGLQGGLVVDYMRDDWYLDLDLSQLRGEVSWVFPNCHELGVWFTTSTRDNSTQAVIFEDIDNRIVLNETYETNDLFTFFYRRRFNDFGGEGRVFAGFSGQSDGVIGADMRLPITHRLAIRTDFTYLIPESNNDALDHRAEGWNVGISLIWHLGPPSVGCDSYYRPLLNVANNGNFLLRRQ